jgi:hypothetical protein
MRRDNWVSPTKSYTQDSSLRLLTHGPIQSMEYDQPPIKPWVWTALVLSVVVIAGIYYIFT